LPREEWIALMRDAHPGYIRWEDFERNQELLLENSAAHGDDRRRSPPREGPALLQGLVICGRCGVRMTVRYRQQANDLRPIYVCQRDGIRRGEPLCQQMPGATIDDAVGKLVIEAVTPMTIDITLAVQSELEARVEEADALRRKHIERAQYEVDLARRRFMRVDPDNRLVADSLEGEWNTKLRALSDAQDQYARQRDDDRMHVDGETRARVLALANDVPSLWRDPATPDRERKRMLRLLIEDVTLLKGNEITAHVRFRGGAARTLLLPKPLPAWKLRQIDPAVVAEIDRLIDAHTDAEIATILRKRGVRTYEGTVPHRLMIRRIRIEYGLKSRFDRLRAAGMLTRHEVAKVLGVAVATIKAWRTNGWLHALAYDDKGGYLFERPGKDAPKKYAWKRRTVGTCAAKNGRSAV
jgi:hypothetical protein